MEGLLNKIIILLIGLAGHFRYPSTHPAPWPQLNVDYLGCCWMQLWCSGCIQYDDLKSWWATCDHRWLLSREKTAQFKLVAVKATHYHCTNQVPRNDFTAKSTSMIQAYTDEVINRRSGCLHVLCSICVHSFGDWRKLYDYSLHHFTASQCTLNGAVFKFLSTSNRLEKFERGPFNHRLRG